jgi:hypothetical protein
MHDLDPDAGFIFNLHREFFFILQTQTITSGCVHLKKGRKGRKKIPLLGKAVP